VDRGEYDARGPAADGSFGMEYPDDRGERQELRQERREERQERREDWQEYDEDDYYGGYYDDYDDYDDYEEGEAGVYWTLPCEPNVIALEGVLYYVCDSTWYIRAYDDDGLAYTEVPNPTGH
jgi:hypothetical protein